jgi:hypothetical protein
MHWSSRSLAGGLGVDHATVAAKDYGVRPWRAETFKFSTDPELVAKVTDIIGLYLAPRAPRGADDLSGGESLRRRTCRSRDGEAGGSLIREVPGRVGAVPTTPGRVSTARWGEFGKRDEEEYARNQRDYVPRKVGRLKSGG